MKKDHRIELEKAIREVLIGINHLDVELRQFRKLAEKRLSLDVSYLSVASEFRELAQAIEDSVNQEEE